MMTKPRSQTITIILPTGNPRGIRKVARTTNNNISLLEIPRIETELERFYAMKEADGMGIYFLVGGEQLYIGQADNLRRRIKQQFKDKPFWQRAFVVALNNYFRTRDHLDYLEKKAIQQAQAAVRFVLENGTAGNARKNLDDSIIADCETIFEEIDTLLAVLNQEFFKVEELSRQPEKPTVQSREGATDEMFPESKKPFQDKQSDSDSKTFYCRALSCHADAKGIWQPEQPGFLILKGSKIRKDYAPSLEGKLEKVQRLKQELIQNKILVSVGENWVFQQDYFIPGRPSAASNLILGFSSNGWVVWKNAQGQTLDEVYRKDKKNSETAR